MRIMLGSSSFNSGAMLALSTRFDAYLEFSKRRISDLSKDLKVAVSF